jgi:hypothetical protein
MSGVSVTSVVTLLLMTCQETQTKPFIKAFNGDVSRPGVQLNSETKKCLFSYFVNYIHVTHRTIKNIKFGNF